MDAWAVSAPFFHSHLDDLASLLRHLAPLSRGEATGPDERNHENGTKTNPSQPARQRPRALTSFVAGQEDQRVQPVGAKTMGKDPHLQALTQIEDTAEGALLAIGGNGVVASITGIHHAPVAPAVPGHQALQGFDIHPLAHIRTHVDWADGETGSHWGDDRLSPGYWGIPPMVRPS